MDIIDKQELAYLIGAVIGDGSYIRNKSEGGRIRLKFSSSDKEFTFKIMQIIKDVFFLDRRLYCHNSNLSILEEIKLYLKELDIDCFIQNGKGAYALNIWGYKNLVNFKNKIDFNIYRKKYKLLKAIDSYKFIHKKNRILKVNIEKIREVEKMSDEFAGNTVDNRTPGEDTHTVFVGPKPFNKLS